MTKKILLYFFFLILSSISYNRGVIEVHATDLQSPLFNLNVKTVDINGSNAQQSITTIESTYGVKSLLQLKDFGYSLIQKDVSEDFSLNLSQSNINLGDTKPGIHELQTVISIEGTHPNHYDLQMIQEYPLKNASNKTIPATSCNGSYQTCNASLAKSWTSPSSYGLGYNLSGSDIPRDFVGANYFRIFPLLNEGGIPTILTSTSPKVSYKEKINVKVNISPDQPEGTYETAINFIALSVY